MGIILEGNRLANSGDLTRELGFEYGCFRGLARITNTAAIAWQILDAAGNQPTWTNSASDPLYILASAFRIETALAGTNGELLKLGSSATDTGSYIVNSAAVASGSLAVQTARSASVPGTPIAVTSNLTLGLYLHASNVASSNNLVAAAADSPVYIPVEIYYAKRLAGPYSDNINRPEAWARLDAGIS